MLTRLAVLATTLPSLRSQRGLTTVEYALAGALIVVIVVAGLKLIGTNASTTLNNIGSQMS